MRVVRLFLMFCCMTWHPEAPQLPLCVKHQYMRWVGEHLAIGWYLEGGQKLKDACHLDRYVPSCLVAQAHLETL